MGSPRIADRRTGVTEVSPVFSGTPRRRTSDVFRIVNPRAQEPPLDSGEGLGKARLRHGVQVVGAFVARNGSIDPSVRCSSPYHPSDMPAPWMDREHMLMWTVVELKMMPTFSDSKPEIPKIMIQQAFQWWGVPKCFQTILQCFASDSRISWV